MKKIVKVRCPYCKTVHIIREVEYEIEVSEQRTRAVVNCDCGGTFYVDYDRKSLRSK